MRRKPFTKGMNLAPILDRKPITGRHVGIGTVVFIIACGAILTAFPRMQPFVERATFLAAVFIAGFLVFSVCGAWRLQGRRQLARAVRAIQVAHATPRHDRALLRCYQRKGR